MLETVWCAVNRTTKVGVSLGENQEISVLEALKAITINGAYQYFQENEKGSIAKGKQADFVILNKNPLKIDKNKIKEIKVVQTYKQGKCVYQ